MLKKAIIISDLSFFFFLMIRRPPRSTLFPYTTALPISIAWIANAEYFQRIRRTISPAGANGKSTTYASMAAIACRRSEEHTSELQSQSNLVCRLLLEKKKNYLPTSCITLYVGYATFRSA